MYEFIRWTAKNISAVGHGSLGASLFFRLYEKRARILVRVQNIARKGLESEPAGATDKVRRRRRQRLLVSLLWTKAAGIAVEQSGKAWRQSSGASEASSELLLLTSIYHHERGHSAELDDTLNALASRTLASAFEPIRRAMQALSTWAHLMEGKVSRVSEQELAAYLSSNPYPQLPTYLRADILRIQIGLAKANATPLPDISSQTFEGARIAALRKAAADVAPLSPSSANVLISAIPSREQRASAWIGVTKSLKRAWKLPEAVKANDEAISASKSYPALAASAWASRAELLHLYKNPEAAAAAVAKAQTLDPLNVEAALWIKIITGRPCAAPPLALAMSEGKAPATFRTGLRAAQVLEHAGHITDAVKLGNLVLENDREVDKDRDALVRYIGRLHESLGDFQTALAYYLKPTISKSRSANGLGVVRCLLEMGRLEEAKARFAEARSHFASSSREPRFDPINMEIALLEGRIGDGYRLYRFRKVSSDLREALPGIALPASATISELPRESKVLILNEWGPGDEIRLASLFDELADKFPNLTITCEPRLLTLHQRNFPKVKFMPVPRSRREYRHTTYDATSDVSSDSLAYLVTNDVITIARGMDVVFPISDALGELRPDRASFPRRTSFFRAERRASDKWRQKVHSANRADEKPVRVGLTWRSMLQNTVRDRHYLDVRDLGPLASVKGVEYWNLQVDLTEEETSLLRAILPSFHIPEGLDLKNDFEEQAAFLEQMDVVIAPCTTMAEFAAALGCRTLFLSNTYQTVWRRNEDGSDIWHSPSRIVLSSPLGNKASLGRAAAEYLEREVSDLRVGSAANSEKPHPERSRSA